MKPDNTPILPPDDSLEAFIKANRDAFDTYEPDPMLWQQIQARLHATPQVTTTAPTPAAGIRRPSFRPRVWQMAASFALLMGLAIYIFSPKQADQTNNLASGNSDLATYSNELAQADAFYTQLIAQKRAELVKVESKDPQAIQGFLNDLDELDRMYAGLKQELAQTPNPDAVIQAMIGNLRLRMEILTRQLELLQRIQDQLDGNLPAEGENDDLAV